MTIFKANIFFLKNQFFFVDAFNFLDIKYASFTGLDWFDYQLIEGEWPLRRINNNNKKSITAWVELCNRQLNNKNNKTQHARFMRAFYCLKNR